MYSVNQEPQDQSELPEAAVCRGRWERGRERLYNWLRRGLVGTKTGEGRPERGVIAHTLAKKGTQGSKKGCQGQRTQSESATEASALPDELSPRSMCEYVCLCMHVCMHLCAPVCVRICVCM